MTFADIVNKQIVPLGDAVVGLLYAVAFILFLIGMVRFFFMEGEEGRAKGKQLAFWGIIGLVVLFAVSLCYSTSRAAVELALVLRKHGLNVRELRQSSPNSPARLRYSADYKGLKFKFPQSHHRLHLNTARF